MTLTIVASIYSHVYNNTWYQDLNTYVTFSKKLIFLLPEWNVNSISDPQLQIRLDQGNWKKLRLNCEIFLYDWCDCMRSLLKVY